MTEGTTITMPAGQPFVEMTRDFAATPRQLFRAMTEPELLKNWLGPRNMTMTVEHYDASTGGGYRYTHIDDRNQEWKFRGVFHTVRPDEFIVQTFEFEGEPDLVAIETARLTDLGDGRTRLTQHSVFPTVEARDGSAAQGMEHGMRDSMDRLAELLTAE